ncbi:DUF4350 domain-containing protein [Actinomadura sp. DC4]|uniref:DUF4350 domain-containing protein n=1 Tax=Actinomadura sp. DC4 TaxID=3055069 RepID=UPI0025B04FF7|nr:DUF4350 domain-containing protein [Actinomadura sp. DC4]MDN3355544.1 DUF4350 domain-containing protein [Actinomadura sp. DC4]
MTTTTETAAPPAAPESARSVARRRWNRSRGILVVVLALLVLGVALAALRPTTRPEFLDPDSPGRQGTRALAEITRQHGTPVTVARTTSSAANALLTHPDATLVIARSERLRPEDLNTLRSLPGDRLLIEPTADTLDALAPGVVAAGGSSGTFDAGCSLPAATSAGQVGLFGSTVYTAPATAAKCYLDGDHPNLVQLPVGGSTVTVLGSGLPFTNERLTEDGNAALGMNLLGTRSEVVWLLPDPPPPGTGRKSFGDLVPFGVKLAVLQAVIAVVLVALWRARRLGPVVVEPLPVVVRSAEAVEGRARLYRARRAADRAAVALRTGALERLTALLGLPKSAAADPGMATDIVAGIAAHTGEPPAMIGNALYGPPPVDDAELVRLAGYLDELERQVRNS